jgi:predicted DNA-binding transcriptional regulator YafY
MKTKANRLDNDDDGWISHDTERVPDDFPIHLVAETAARLLKGEDYQSAVDRALKLLQQCEDTLHSNKQLRATTRIIMAGKVVGSMQANWDLDAFCEIPEGIAVFKFTEAIRQVTRQFERADRAEVAFLRFFKHIEKNETKRNARLNELRSEGIDAAVTQRWSRQFDELRKAGKLGKRSPRKRNID